MKILVTGAITALTLMVANGANATNGYFTHGTGTKNKGMAGAGIAMPEDAIAIANNPAAAAFLPSQFGVGAALFSPLRSYTTSASQAQGQGGAFTIGPNDLDSNREYFAIPHVAKSWSLANDSAWALAFYGRGGMNSRWSGGSATFDPDGPGPAPVSTLPGTFGAGEAGVDLSQAFIDIAYAKRFSNFSLGASAVIAIQAFEATGVATFAAFTQSFAASGGTVLPTSLSNNGHEFSFGAGIKLGLHSQLSEQLDLAVMYQTEIGMGEFDDYADLFAEQGSFDIPANAKLGISYRPSDSLALSFDVEHTWFSDVDSVGNPFANLFSCPTAGAGGMDLSSCLGGDRGAGFGWDDVTTFKVGAQWTSGNDWTWRAGFSHTEQPISESEVLFNILAPAVVEDHVTAGFTKNMSSNQELSLSFMYALEGSVNGANVFDPTQTIELEMHQFELEISYGWKF